jgi:hypothetical protein
MMRALPRQAGQRVQRNVAWHEFSSPKPHFCILRQSLRNHHWKGVDMGLN